MFHPCFTPFPLELGALVQQGPPLDFGSKLSLISVQYPIAGARTLGLETSDKSLGRCKST